MSSKYTRRRESSSDSDDSNLSRMFQKFIKRYKHQSKTSEVSEKENGGHKKKRHEQSNRCRDREMNISTSSQARSIFSSRRDSAEFAESENTEFFNMDIDEESNNEIQEVTPQEGDPLQSEEIPVPILPKDILQVLGDDVKGTQKTGDVIHADIATRWDNILKQGLDVEVRTNLMAKYPPISNCPLVEAPKLNLEVKSSINELVRRDTRLAEIQHQVGACLGAIGSALTILVGQPEGGVANNIQLIEKISDAGRLLADIHQSETETRRVLVAANLNKKVKNTMMIVPRDEWLFGVSLAERVKETKALEKSSMELKSVAQKQKYTSTGTVKRSVNYRGPSRQTSKSYSQGGPKYQPQKKNSKTPPTSEYQFKKDRKRRY